MSRPHQYSVCVCLLLAAIIGLHLGVLALLFQRAAHSTDSTQHLLSDYSHLRSSVGGSLLHHEGHSSGGSSERRHHFTHHHTTDVAPEQHSSSHAHDGSTVVPKIALLFLAPLGPQNDAVWLKFLRDAAELTLPHSSPQLADALRNGPGFNLSLVGNLHPPWRTPEQPPSLSSHHNQSLMNQSQRVRQSTAAGAHRAQQQHSQEAEGSSWAAAVLNTFKQAWGQLERWKQAAARGAGAIFKSDPMKLGMPIAKWEAAAVHQEARQLQAGVLSGAGRLAYQAQRLFSVYVLTHAGHSQPSSVFAGREVSSHLDLKHAYGQPTLMQASRLLLATALKDPANVRFVLLSDTSIPVIPAPLAWAQLLSERLSRVDSCVGNAMDTHRRSPCLRSEHLRPEHWRKSSQWFSLTRNHAALAVADQHVAPLFSAYCQSPGAAGPHTPPAPACNTSTATALCIADEHYMPSLLASYGLDNQTDCTGVAHFADWVTTPGSSHPRSFTPSDLTPHLAARLHTEHDASGRTKGEPFCHWATAASSLSRVFSRPGDVDTPAANSTFSSTQHTDLASDQDGSRDLDQWVADWVRQLGYLPVSSRCSVFARKFPSVNGPPARKTAPRSVGQRGEALSRAVRVGQGEKVGDDALLQWVLSCESGLGMDRHCYKQTERVY